MSAKKIFLVLIYIIFTLSIFSCSSSLYITNGFLTPAEIDMSERKNAVITSTTATANDDLDRKIKFSNERKINITPFVYTNLSDSLANYFNARFIENISTTNYFNKIITPPESDLISKPGAGESLGISRIELIKSNNINAIIKTDISDLKIEEIVDARPVYKTVKKKNSDGTTTSKKILDYVEYTLEQTAFIEVTMSIVDPVSGNTQDVRKLSDKTSKKYSINEFTMHSYSMENEIKDLIDQLSIKIANKIIPHNTYVKYKVMDNDPKNAQAGAAYKFLSNNKPDVAMEVFEEVWNKNHHVPSGYNYALLLAHFNNIDEAIRVLSHVVSIDGREEAYSLLYEMKSYKKIINEAQTQL